MKYLVVIALVLLLFVLLYRRLQPYLQSARNFIAAVRQVQQAMHRGSAPAQPEKLVQCERCGTWVPAGRALAANQAYYCSEQCRSDRAARKSAKRRMRAE